MSFLIKYHNYSNKSTNSEKVKKYKENNKLHQIFNLPKLTNFQYYANKKKEICCRDKNKYQENKNKLI